MAKRGRPFQPGNKFGRGRPRGSRNKVTLAAQQLIDKHAAPIVNKTISMALEGDPVAMRLLMDRIIPPVKEARVILGKLSMKTMADVRRASEAVLKKVTSGELTISEAQGVDALLEGRRKVIETEDLAKSLQAMEAKYEFTEPDKPNEAN